MNPVVLFTLILAACGLFEKHSETDAEPTPATEVLAQRHAAWVALYEQVKDPETGWPSKTDCDGTLWAGLAAAAGAGVQLHLAEYAPGEIHRRPFQPCYPFDFDGDGQPDSRSTVSRDMFTGYLWGIWARRDQGAVRRVVDYGEAHDWIMGQPDSANEVSLGNNLTGAACRMLSDLTDGADDRTCAARPSAYFPVSADYERHIQVLGILLQGEVAGGMAITDIDGVMLDRIKENADSDPSDALFQAAFGVYTGNYERAVELLNDDAYACPSYVRGAEAYCLVHKLFAASIVLKHHKG